MDEIIESFSLNSTGKFFEKFQRESVDKPTKKKEKKRYVSFQHLEDTQQSYWEHMKQAMKYSWLSLKSSACFFTHAFWPDMYQGTGSTIVSELNETIAEQRKQQTVEKEQEVEEKEQVEKQVQVENLII